MTDYIPLGFTTINGINGPVTLPGVSRDDSNGFTTLAFTATGQTRNAMNTDVNVEITYAGAYAAATISLPDPAYKGQKISFSCNLGSAAAITWIGVPGTNLPAAMNTGTQFSVVASSLGSWVRMG